MDIKKNICQHQGCEKRTYLKNIFWHCNEHNPMKILKTKVNKYICDDVSNIIIDYYYSMNDFDEFKDYYSISYCSESCTGHTDHTLTQKEFLLGYHMSYGNWFMAENILKTNDIRDEFKERAIMYTIRFGMYSMAKYFLEQKEMKYLQVQENILNEARDRYDKEDMGGYENFINYLMNRHVKINFPEFDIEIKVTKKKENNIKDEEEDPKDISSEM